MAKILSLSPLFVASAESSQSLEPRVGVKDMHSLLRKRVLVTGGAGFLKDGLRETIGYFHGILGGVASEWPAASDP
jgi:hypothetical protein